LYSSGFNAIVAYELMALMELLTNENYRLNAIETNSARSIKGEPGRIKVDQHP